MKVLLLTCLTLAASAREMTNPLQKVLSMLGRMQSEMIEEGEAQQKAFTEFANMCRDRSAELKNEIKISKARTEDLQATVNKANDDNGELGTQIEELSSKISTSDSDLKAASRIREKEAAEFAMNQKDLLDTISQMERAMSIMQKQMKGGAFAQVEQQTRALALTQALSTIVDASFINSADANNLASLIQSAEDSKEDAADAQLDSAVESMRGNAKKGANILDVLESLLEKAQAQLQGTRNAETKSRHSFKLFKASLERKLEVGTKDMNDVKKAKSAAGQIRAEAEGNLDMVKKDLAEDKKALGDLHHECMTRAEDFEDETKSRNDEVQALATARKLLKEMTGGAEKKTYDEFAQLSFVQTRSEKSSSVKAVDAVKKLGEAQNMPTLIQMAHKMEAVVRNSMVAGQDPFKRVKSMVSSMLNKLNKQMEDEAGQKEYCDKEMVDSQKNKELKEGEVEKLTTRIDTQSSDSMNLKEQVAELQKELVANQKTQKEMNKMRQQEHALFKKTRPQLETGLSGVKQALKVLRDYYSQDADTEKSHDANQGGGVGVINMLEVVESDFSKILAALVEEEDTAQKAYEEQSSENTRAKTLKEQAAIAKTRGAKSLDKATSESSTDRDSVQSELDAVNEYFAKIQQECVAKAEPHEERRKRQQATLKGLKEAAETLASDAPGLLQQNSRYLRHARSLRGSEDDVFE